MAATNETGTILSAARPAACLSPVRAIGKHRLSVTWSTGARAGRTDEVDVSSIIRAYKIYRPLRDDPALFATVTLIEDGFVVGWDGPDLEMTAEVIERCLDKPTTV